MKIIPFILYALMILVVSFSCVHKEASTDSTKPDEVKLEEDIRCVDFWGISLHDKGISSIVKKMEKEVDVFSLDGNMDEEQGYCKVHFCGVPCGMNIGWEEKDGVVCVQSLNFMTSQKSKEAISALVKSISSYYGECQQDEQDKIDDYYRWAGVLMRPIHSEEGGMVIIFY